MIVERYPMTSPENMLGLLEATLRLTERVTERIEALGPAPSRRAHAQLMRELRASLADFRHNVALLKRQWNEASVRRLVRNDRRDRVIVRLFRQLGAPGCAQL